MKSLVAGLLSLSYASIGIGILHMSMAQFWTGFAFGLCWMILQHVDI